MSHTLLTKAPLLRAAPRRTLQQTVRASYHSSSGPRMPSASQQLRSLIRQTTLRASALAVQRSSYPVSQQFHTPPTNHFSTQHQQQRSRSPSPPPPYSARNLTLRAAPDQWTHFNNTPYNTLSSVRTFSSSRKLHWPAPETPTSISPDSQSRIDAAIEEISDLYGTAKDEFEIASEESEKNTTYAADDREAAREELDRLLGFYKGVVEGEDRVVADEVRRRVGQRIRELESAVVAMEEAAMHGD